MKKQNSYHDWHYLHVLLVILLSIVSYSNSFKASFHFDDEHIILDNSEIKNLTNFNPSVKESSKGYPIFKTSRYIGYLTFAMNYSLHKYNVIGYHVVNLAIHILNAILVYILVLLTLHIPHVRENTNYHWRTPSHIAVVSALLFACHPIQTQAVTYIVQRFASLVTLFYILAIILYIKSRLAVTTGAFARSYVFALISAVVAMKTKETAFTLPVLIATFEFLYLKGNIKKRVLLLIPFLLTMIIIPISLLGMERPLGEIIGDVNEITKVHTEISRWEYLMTQFRVIMTYLRLVFIPINQNLDYDYPVYRNFFDPNVILSFLMLIGLFGAAIYLLYRSKRPDGTGTPSPVTLYRLISFGILWFFITLSVESSIIPIVDVIFEHRMYLPSIGVFISIGTGICILAERLKNTWQNANKAVIAAFLMIILFLTMTTFLRNRIWRDEITLWEDVVKKSPGKVRAHNNLGVSYNEKALESYANRLMLDKAIEHLKIAIKLDPSYAEAYNNLGSALSDKGLNEKAIEYYEIALILNPSNYNAHYNLGTAYIRSGLIDKGIKEIKMSLRINPDFKKAHMYLNNISK